MTLSNKLSKDAQNWTVNTSFDVVVICKLASLENLSGFATSYSYTLYNDKLTIDLSTYQFSQQPSCGFALTRSTTWDLNSAPISQDASVS